MSLLTPSMSIVREGVPRFNKIGTAFATTAFSAVARRQELYFLYASFTYPESLASHLVFSRGGLLLGGRECFERSAWYFLPLESGALVPLLSLVGHSLPKRPKPWNS